MKGILDNTNPNADARLVADVMNAPTAPHLRYAEDVCDPRNAVTAQQITHADAIHREQYGAPLPAKVAAEIRTSNATTPSGVCVACAASLACPRCDKRLTVEDAIAEVVTAVNDPNVYCSVEMDASRHAMYFRDKPQPVTVEYTVYIARKAETYTRPISEQSHSLRSAVDAALARWRAGRSA